MMQRHAALAIGWWTLALVGCASTNRGSSVNGTGAGGSMDTTSGSGGSMSSSGTGSSGRGGSSNGGSGGSSNPPVDGGTAPPGCTSLAMNASVKLGTYDTDQIVWRDSACKERQAALVRVGGGYVRQFVYDFNGKPRKATGTGAAGHNGWGYTVNHAGNGATIGQGVAGAFKPLFVGRHHALYEYSFTVAINGQNVPVTQHWFFATGRDNPVVATTYDVHGSAPGSLIADTRTPYGDIAWDGDENASSTVVDGVGWGDRYKFITTSAPLTMNSKWDYSQKNVVPYVLEWTTKTDAEMGAVQTQTYLQHDAGGYWFYDNWGKTSDNAAPPKMGQAGRMTVTWNWTYQLDQYELCLDTASCVNNTTGSHRLAWGANYGAIGGSTAGSPMYSAYGDDKMVSGHPFNSYSVFMVLGPHSAAPVFRQVTEIETVQATHVTASVGTVKTMGPGGVGRTDLVQLAPAGYDQRYAVWTVDAPANHVAMHVGVDSGTLETPVLAVTNFTASAPPAVKVDGVTKTADADYFMSLDPASKQVWITFRPGWSGAHDIEIQ